MKKKALGRGLSALLETPSPKMETADETKPSQHNVLWLAPDQIECNRNQPRKTFDPESLDEMVQSIKARGILQPLVARRHPDDASRYELIAGERRLRASKEAGLATVPVVVWEATEEETLELALIENLQREDLNPLEEASAYARLQERFGLTQEQVAQKVGKRRSTVANSLRLLELTADEQRHLMSGMITAGHARALLSIANPLKRSELLKQIVQDGLSVRRAEEIAQSPNKSDSHRKKQKTAQKLSPDMFGIQEALRDALGTKVTLVPKRGRGGTERPGGRIVVEYYTDDDIERILKQVGATYE